MDKHSLTYEQTINHIKNNYPLSNESAIANIRKATLRDTSNNPNLVLFTTNQRIDKMREEDDKKRGQVSFKSYILEQERIKCVKLKIARGLRKTFGS